MNWSTGTLEIKIYQTAKLEIKIYQAGNQNEKMIVLPVILVDPRDHLEPAKVVIQSE